MFTQLNLTKLLKEPVLSIARQNIAQNAYWAHPEILLVSMLADQSKTIRTKAVEEILKLRGNADLGDDKPRLYEVPHLQAKSYTEIIEL